MLIPITCPFSYTMIYNLQIFSQNWHISQKTYYELFEQLCITFWIQSFSVVFRTDLSKSQIAITQFFPDKRLNGWYEIEGSLLGNKFHNEGPWNLALFGYVQTLTVNRQPSDNSFLAQNPGITVKCKLQSCDNLKLHIGNLAKGRTFIGEYFSVILLYNLIIIDTVDHSLRFNSTSKIVISHNHDVSQCGRFFFFWSAKYHTLQLLIRQLRIWTYNTSFDHSVLFFSSKLFSLISSSLSLELLSWDFIFFFFH